MVTHFDLVFTMQAHSLLAPKTKNKKSILEQPVPKGSAQVSLSAFGYLFMEVLPFFMSWV